MLTSYEEIVRKIRERTVRWILELPPISCSVIKIHGFSIPIQPYLPIEHFQPKPRAYEPFEPIVFKPLESKPSTIASRWVATQWANFTFTPLYPTIHPTWCHVGWIQSPEGHNVGMVKVPTINQLQFS